MKVKYNIEPRLHIQHSYHSLFLLQRLSTLPRFATEARGNSEMVYSKSSSF